MCSSLHYNPVALFEFDMIQKLKAQNQRIEPIWKHRSCLGFCSMWIVEPCGSWLHLPYTVCAVVSNVAKVLKSSG